jgi:C1A family cysteine protease
MGKVSDVKDQGQCGDCWAFATTGLYESLLLIQQNQNYDLAEQYVLDCTSGSSCNGGIPNDALKMFTQTGIPQESAYPYKQQNNYYGSGICQAANKIKLSSTVTSVNHYNAMTDA